jgi:hypothetical protein
MVRRGQGKQRRGVIKLFGRYCLYAEDNQEIRDIFERTNGNFKTGEIFPTDQAPVLIKQQNIVKSIAVKWGFPGFRGKGVIESV